MTASANHQSFKNVPQGTAALDALQALRLATLQRRHHPLLLLLFHRLFWSFSCSLHKQIVVDAGFALGLLQLARFLRHAFLAVGLGRVIRIVLVDCIFFVDGTRGIAIPNLWNREIGS